MIDLNAIFLSEERKFDDPSATLRKFISPTKT